MSRGERRILWKSARLGSIHCQCCRPDQIPQGFYQEMMTKSLILVVWYHPQHKPQTLLVKIWHLRSLAVLSGSHAFKAHQEILPSWGKISHRMGIAFAYLSQQKLEISPSEPNWNNWSAWKQTCVSPSAHTRNREKLAKKHRSSTGCMPWLLEFQQHMNIKHCRDIPTGSHEKREGPLSIHFLENWNTIACPQLLSPLQQETFCKPDSLALVATAGLGPTNIALNMAWDYANTIKTISKSVFFCCVCHGKTPGLCHGNSWENEISYKITCKI